MEFGLYLFRVPISPTSFKEGGGQAVYKVFFIQAVDISLLSPPQNAFPAGRLQLISSSQCSEEMDLLLVLSRLGVACCRSSRKIKRSFFF
ncbi:MAG: hypothetical protein EA344_13285 [Alkalicoccus sp.]|uniref:Uncharacterized protein n=1 Tax=Alkalicoccus sp. TaxID=2005376 RepID=A0A651E1U5_9BACI|nr:MAG: hypothetical protein EA344_13285 [Alkalicoccus sp.]